MVAVLLLAMPLVLEVGVPWVYDRLYTSIYGPPRLPISTSVILIECDIPGAKPLLANSIAGRGVEFVVVPLDGSTSAPASLSTETFAIPQRGLIVACQYTAVPGKVRDTDDPTVAVYS